MWLVARCPLCIGLVRFRFDQRIAEKRKHKQDNPGYPSPCFHCSFPFVCLRESRTLRFRSCLSMYLWLHWLFGWSLISCLFTGLSCLSGVADALTRGFALDVLLVSRHHVGNLRFHIWHGTSPFLCCRHLDQQFHIAFSVPKPAHIFRVLVSGDILGG